MQMWRTISLLGVLNSAFAPLCRGSTVRIGVTGDVNLDPFLHGDNYGYPWGDTLSTTQKLDAFLINHEATIANVVDANPNNFQMEDPINFTQTFVEAGVDAVVFANNHQFDYNRSGLDETIKQALQYDIPAAGVGYEDEVRKPLLLDVEGVPVALFTAVLINCELDPETGKDIPHTCTCGINETRAGMMDQQCYPATTDAKGQWFYPDITDAYIQDIQSIISAFRASNPSTFVLTYLHVGPNFQWSPDPTRLALLRGMVDAGSDAVWGTSSHHVQVGRLSSSAVLFCASANPPVKNARSLTHLYTGRGVVRRRPHHLRNGRFPVSALPGHHGLLPGLCCAVRAISPRAGRDACAQSGSQDGR